MARRAAATLGGNVPRWRGSAGDKVLAVLQMEEGKWKVRRGSNERQWQCGWSSLGGRVDDGYCLGHI
jgi:hypothetical protein